MLKFEKVSKERFMNDLSDIIYSSVKLPERATKGSAGYDFFAPFDLELEPGETIKIPTGIRAVMDYGWVLAVFPRSGLGFKYKVRLNNTVGIIDADYSESDNEGHIFIKITNEGDKPVSIKTGEAFAQGIFFQHGITDDDVADGQRNGGFGSTSK